MKAELQQSVVIITGMGVRDEMTEVTAPWGVEWWAFRNPYKVAA
jgi:hypothetical protein